MPLSKQTQQAPLASFRYVFNWWVLPSGATVQVCKLWRCGESDRMVASLRYVNENGDLSVNAFDMALNNVTRYGRRVAIC